MMVVALPAQTVELLFYKPVDASILVIHRLLMLIILQVNVYHVIHPAMDVQGKQAQIVSVVKLAIITLVENVYRVVHKVLLPLLEVYVVVKETVLPASKYQHVVYLAKMYHIIYIITNA